MPKTSIKNTMGHIPRKKSWSNSSLFNHKNIRKLVAQINPRSDRFPPTLQKEAHNKFESNESLHIEVKKKIPTQKTFRHRLYIFL